MTGLYWTGFLSAFAGLAWSTNISAQPTETGETRPIASGEVRSAATSEPWAPPEIKQLAQNVENGESSKTADDGYGADLQTLYKQANDGVPRAQYQLAERYRLGLSVKRDDNRAIELYDLSARQGYALSQFRLAEFYEQGEILKKDLAKAIEFYRKAAEQGHSGAQYALAHSYHIGNGVPVDMAKAIYWYHKAAEQGDVWSQLTLGDQYRAGANVSKDLVQSTQWYQRAAEQGNMFAQYELGNAYRYGQGIDKDVLRAMEWYRLASESGNSSADQALNEIQGEVANFVPSQSLLLATEIDQSKSASPGLAKQEKTELAAVTVSSGTGDTATRADGASDGGDGASDQSIESATGGAESTGLAAQVELTPAPEPAPPEEFESAFLLTSNETNIVEEAISSLLAKAQNQVAQLALTTPKGDNAYETYQHVLAVNPSNSAALAGIREIGARYAALAERARARGQFERADRYMAKATELAPDHPSVKALRTATAAQPSPSLLEAPSVETSGDPEPLQEESTQAQQTTQSQSIAALPPTPEEAPGDAKIATATDIGPAKPELVTSGLLYAVSALDAHGNGDFEKAIEFYGLAIAAGDLNDRSLAYVHNNRGASYRSMGMYDLAIEDYDNAIRLNPDYATAVYNRGIAYDRKGYRVLAIDDFDTAIRLKPDLADAYIQRGIALMKDGRHEGAIEDFSQAIQLDSNLDSAYFNRGLTYQSLGDLERAIEDIKKSHAMSPDNGEYAQKMRELGIL